MRFYGAAVILVMIACAVPFAAWGGDSAASLCIEAGRAETMPPPDEVDEALWKACLEGAGKELPGEALPYTDRWRLSGEFQCWNEQGGSRCHATVRNPLPMWEVTALVLRLEDATAGPVADKVVFVSIPPGEALSFFLKGPLLPPLHLVRILQAWGRRP